MKAFLIFSLLCICVYYSHAEIVTTLGDCDDFILLDRVRMYKPAKKIIFLLFPTKGIGIEESEFIISGVRHIDYEQVPSNFTKVDGEFGEGRVWIKITSQKGYAIKSIIEFCGSEIMGRTESISEITSGFE